MIQRYVPISVVIPCFRCTKTIWRAINSILNQTVQPVEVILVDDASGDETLNMLRDIEHQHTNLIKVLSLANNMGAGSARNAGWAAATQPYLAFLDADDAWHPQKLEVQYAYMQQHPEISLCGHARRILVQKDELPHWDIQPNVEAQAVIRWQLLLSNQFVTPSVMLRRDIQPRFVEKQRHMEDHMLWLIIVCAGGKATKLSAELAAIYKSPYGEAGLSSHIWSMGKSDLSNYQRLYRNGYINLAQEFLLALFSGLKFIRRLFIYWGYMRWKK